MVKLFIFFEKFLIFLKIFLIFCKKCYNTHFCINIVKQPCFSDFPRVSRLELEVAFFVNIFFFEFFSKFLWHRICALRSTDRNSGFLSKIWDSQHRNVAFFENFFRQGVAFDPKILVFHKSDTFLDQKLLVFSKILNVC